MKFKFVWVGKTKDQNWLALQDDYMRRLSHFVKCQVAEVKDTGDRKTEGERILEKLNQSTFACLLDVKGRSVSSHDLAKEVENWQRAAHKEVAFIVGGADGVSPGVAERANSVLSLSFLTFTHEMVRVVMLEQLYRAYTIIKGYPYQK